MKDLLKFPLNIQLFADDNEDTLIAKEKARAKHQSQKQDDKTTKTDSEEPLTATQAVNPYIDKYAQAEIKFAMTQNGIDATKANRAVRLIDQSMVLTEDGEVDAEKLNTAIADLLKEWPELAPAKGEDGKTFKIGSDKTKDKGKDNDLIAKAFGNTK